VRERERERGKVGSYANLKDLQLVHKIALQLLPAPAKIGYPGVL
jgi:hypothetical protein